MKEILNRVSVELFCCRVLDCNTPRTTASLEIDGRKTVALLKYIRHLHDLIDEAKYEEEEKEAKSEA